jgi:Flp pilus assembly protein TadD
VPRRFAPQPQTQDPVSRALRLRRRGETRKALQTLRLACCQDDQNARLWGLYGFQALLAGKVGEAADAINRAAWLFERQHSPRRAGAVRLLLQRLATLADGNPAHA